ncbi:hypothetical protein [Sphingomonas panni]|uniref:hypothetical protein n=1 Tax=Sphingomonas panni TaxID=237612 RepID=UPI001F5B568E|nr:hypothetical protein [Sphingomonas panni]
MIEPGAIDDPLPPPGTPIRFDDSDMILLGRYLDGRLALVRASDFGAFGRGPTIVAAAAGMVTSLRPDVRAGPSATHGSTGAAA